MPPSFDPLAPTNLRHLSHFSIAIGTGPFAWIRRSIVSSLCVVATTLVVIPNQPNKNNVVMMTTFPTMKYLRKWRLSLATQGVIENKVDQMEIKVQGLGLMELGRQPRLHWKTLNHICPMGVPITRAVSKWIQNHLVHPLEIKLIPQLLMKLLINKRGWKKRELKETTKMSCTISLTLAVMP